MRYSLFTVLVSLLLSACTLTSNNPVEISAQHYRIYRGDGSASSLAELLDDAAGTQVVFIGESHNDPVAHYLEAEIYQRLWQPELVLSLEMFETDVQYVLDEYLDGLISESHLLESGRAWNNYEGDYKALLEFARENGGHVIAANAPRRYVNLVGREGNEALEELSEQALANLPPLPYPAASPAYREKFMALMQMPVMSRQDDHNASTEESEESEESEEQRSEILQMLERSLQAQSLWDATMAWSIATYLDSNPDARILQVNGVFHSEGGMGIPEQLQQYRAGTSSLVVTITDSSSFPDFSPEDMLNKGDFVIVTDASLPRTY